jgi:hypothetical protein
VSDHVKDLLDCGLREAKPLVGATVTDATIQGDFLGLLFRCADGKTRVAWVQRDPEGNGPGWLAIEGVSDEPPAAAAKLRHLTPDEVRARMADPRFQITGKDPCEESTEAPCIVCAHPTRHVEVGGDGYTCSGMVGGDEHLYLYCCEGCDKAHGTSVFYGEKDYLGLLGENGDGLFVVWRCPCDALTLRQGWKPKMVDECPDYGSAYDVVGDRCHACKRRRDDPKRARAGRKD